RILPRLKPEDWAGFVRVRGRVAAILAQISVQGRRQEVARRIVHAYGRAMPRVWSTHLLRLGAASGSLAWHLACGIIRLRELQKGLAGAQPLLSSRELLKAFLKALFKRSAIAPHAQ